MRVLVQHRSHYAYPEPANLGLHTIRLCPTGHVRARVETYSLKVPQAERVQWIIDPYGNKIARASFDPTQPTRELDVIVELAVELHPVNPFDFYVDEACRELPFAYPDDLSRELAPFMQAVDPALRGGARLDAFLASLPKRGEIVSTIVEINQAVHERVKYVIREEPGTYTPEECLTHGRGSCRDMAVLLLAAYRSRGLAARFVSGYLIQPIDEGMLPDLPKGMSQDVVDLHAWCEVFVPGAGWIGVDATSGLMCGEGHIPLACATTPSLAAPLVGTTDVPTDDVGFEMFIARLGHEPQPTKPYTDEQWGRMQAAASAVDEALARQGVVLTMGGEPTFCSREDAELPEWNGAALGASKWTHGLRLAAELRRRMHPGGVLFQRMGKHYPGESLPRWALDVIGRKDGEPLWHDEGRIIGTLADDRVRLVAEEIAAELGVPGFVMPAYEDPWFAISTEQNLPVDLDPTRVRLDDAMERRFLARMLTRGLRRPAGFVLPLRKHDGRWHSQLWELRREQLFLLPGDGPVGLRLPLDRVGGDPWLLDEADVVTDPRDPRLADEELEEQTRLMGLDAPKARFGTSIRTALCVELRDDASGQPRLHVFLPPLGGESEFVELVGVVDAITSRHGLDVVLEGYPPRRGPALALISVTPDPGVLEVNIPPTTSLPEYVALQHDVFDAALHSGLHSEKFLVDGRLAGSGGGHHIVFGGPSTLESPFLRRPDLLASLITFCQHHPALSFLFTGLFVGPTSQAPRVDEARMDSLYELEIALCEAFASRSADQVPPWKADLLFRHLLTDVTGNTHRAEISLDKLFSPHGPTGRLGLVELRAFEMPPHPRMVVAQMLLVRALLASFVAQPYDKPLVRWGQRLHDQFLLPYWLWGDLEDVLAYLRERGFTLDAEMYRPFLELRCPLVGALRSEGIVLEVRNAIEPWHVLGEEPAHAGTVRYVDSSLERVEVRAVGIVPERHLVLVNGRELPLRSGRRADDWVGGVRFRAWAPPHSLHAHLGIHHPLHFDVLDRWTGRSVGACQYHVWHPEGRAFASPPLTRFEAAARRSQRFTVGQHSAFPVVSASSEPHGEQPWTLDLRRFAMDRPMPVPRDE